MLEQKLGSNKSEMHEFHIPHELAELRKNEEARKREMGTRSQKIFTLEKQELREKSQRQNRQSSPHETDMAATESCRQIPPERRKSTYRCRPWSREIPSAKASTISRLLR